MAPPRPRTVRPLLTAGPLAAPRLSIPRLARSLWVRRTLVGAARADFLHWMSHLVPTLDAGQLEALVLAWRRLAADTPSDRTDLQRCLIFLGLVAPVPQARWESWLVAARHPDGSLTTWKCASAVRHLAFVDVLDHQTLAARWATLCFASDGPLPLPVRASLMSGAFVADGGASHATHLERDAQSDRPIVRAWAQTMARVVRRHERRVIRDLLRASGPLTPDEWNRLSLVPGFSWTAADRRAVAPRWQVPTILTTAAVSGSPYEDLSNRLLSPGGDAALWRALLPTGSSLAQWHLILAASSTATFSRLTRDRVLVRRWLATLVAHPITESLTGLQAEMLVRGATVATADVWMAAVVAALPHLPASMIADHDTDLWRTVASWIARFPDRTVPAEILLHLATAADSALRLWGLSTVTAQAPAAPPVEPTVPRPLRRSRA